MTMVPAMEYLTVFNGWFVLYRTGMTAPCIVVSSWNGISMGISPLSALIINNLLPVCNSNDAPPSKILLHQAQDRPEIHPAEERFSALPVTGYHDGNGPGFR